MVNKLANAIKDEHNLTSDASKKIANYINDQYVVVDDSDVQYFLDNLRVFNSRFEAAAYEMHERSINDLTKNMDNPIDQKQVGNSLLNAWLNDQDYYNLDIENTDIWFTIYE